jgi:hypothetical protein
MKDCAFRSGLEELLTFTNAIRHRVLPNLHMMDRKSMTR